MPGMPIPEASPPLDQTSRFGLRSIRIWIADTRAAGFDEECARQAKRIADAESDEPAADDLAWFEASDKAGWGN